MDRYEWNGNRKGQDDTRLYVVGPCGMGRCGMIFFGMGPCDEGCSSGDLCGRGLADGKGSFGTGRYAAASVDESKDAGFSGESLFCADLMHVCHHGRDFGDMKLFCHSCFDGFHANCCRHNYCGDHSSCRLS